MPAARGGLAVRISGPTTFNYLPTSNTSKQTSVPKGTSCAEGGWVVGCQGSASRASTGAGRRIHDKRIPPFSCPRWRLTCRIPCVPRPRHKPRSSYLKPPAIEARGGWVRRGGAFSRASGPIWVAWPRPAVGGLQPSNDALVTLAPASGLGHTQQHNHQQQQQQLPLPLLVLLLAGVCLCSGLFLCVLACLLLCSAPPCLATGFLSVALCCLLCFALLFALLLALLCALLCFVACFVCLLCLLACLLVCLFVCFVLAWLALLACLLVLFVWLLGWSIFCLFSLVCLFFGLFCLFLAWFALLVCLVG